MPDPNILARIEGDLDDLIARVALLGEPRLTRFADRLNGTRHELRDVVALEKSRG